MQPQWRGWRSWFLPSNSKLSRTFLCCRQNSCKFLPSWRQSNRRWDSDFTSYWPSITSIIPRWFRKWGSGCCNCNVSKSWDPNRYYFYHCSISCISIFRLTMEWSSRCSSCRLHWWSVCIKPINLRVKSFRSWFSCSRFWKSSSYGWVRG